MQITLTNTGKRYNREWIFRGVDYVFSAPKKYAITGSNGSGKSTLLQVIAGSLTHTEGQIAFTNLASGKSHLDINQPFSLISMATPYLELIEEFTTREMIAFHQQFKPLTVQMEQAIGLVNLHAAADRQIRYFSSGMKQRLKLALAFFSDTPVLLLDEPTTNLDAEGIALYHTLIDNYTRNRLVLISSNDRQEYDFCDEVVNIMQYKQA